MTRKVLTTNGWQEVTRRRLVAYDDEDHPGSVEACVALTGSASVYPLDCFLGIDRLPFKATADAALAIALAGATCPSYRDAAARLRDDLGVPLSDVLVREVTEYVGEIVLWDDRDHAEATVAAHDPAAIRSSRRGRRPKGGFTLFAMADGAMVDTRAGAGRSSTGSASANTRARRRAPAPSGRGCRAPCATTDSRTPRSFAAWGTEPSG